MPREVRLLLNDVLEYSAAAERISAGKTYLAYSNDERLRLALERCLVNIGEAISQALAQWPDLTMHIADVRKIIGFRHRLVHGYYSIADQICWSIVTDRLPGLVREVNVLVEEVLAQSKEENFGE